MRQIHIHSLINADVEKTWEHYTSPLHIINWNFATDDWQCPKAENNLQVGGKYLARMEVKDGSFGFDFKAVYTEVKPLDSFTYKLADNREITVKFSPKDNAHTNRYLV